MVTHIVLFRPRPNLTPNERDGLAGALETALRDIPTISRVRVGRRVTTGRPYEQLMRTDYPYAALIEFADRDALMAYLQHPAHEQLAAQFFAVFEEALMYDFELQEGAEGIAALR